MAKKKYNLGLTKEYNVVDEITGEVVANGSIPIKGTINIDNGYILFFKNSIDKFCNLWSTDQYIYFNLCFEYGYRHSFAITATFKEKIYNSINIGESSFKKSISRLIEQEFILRENKRGEYRINVLFTFMGGLKEREKELINKIKNN